MYADSMVLNIVYPIYKFFANSKWIYVPGSVIPTISILDNTSDTTCVELALIETWCIAVLGTTIGCKEWHLISLILIQCKLNRVNLYISQSTSSSSICIQIYPFFDLSVPRSIYLSVCCPLHLHSFFSFRRDLKGLSMETFFTPHLAKELCHSLYRYMYIEKQSLYFSLTWRDGDRSLEQVLTASMRISLCSLAKKVSAQWRTKFPCARRCPAWKN